MKRRAKMPRPLLIRDDRFPKGEMELAKVYEKIYKVDNEGKGKDLKAKRDALIFGGAFFGIGMPNDEQALLAMKLSKWLFQYAKWIAKRPQGRV